MRQPVSFNFTPQLGHVSASSLISVLHSLHFIRAIICFYHISCLNACNFFSFLIKQNSHCSKKHGCIYQRLKEEGLKVLKWAERGGLEAFEKCLKEREVKPIRNKF